MSNKFSSITPYNLSNNVFKLVGKDWMLITAGNMQSHNTMTASWGGLGILWNKEVCFCFVRPTRHTYKFIEKSEFFTLSFFEEEYRKMLNFCGSKSGRDYNKTLETGLIPIKSEHGSIYFEQAKLVLECKKLYADDIDPALFVDAQLDKNYPLKDYHRMYIGQIYKVLQKS